MEVVRIVAFNRNETNCKPLKGMQINWLEDFQIDVSSTKIREKIISGYIPAKEVTAEVLDYIQSNHLYSNKL